MKTFSIKFLSLVLLICVSACSVTPEIENQKQVQDSEVDVEIKSSELLAAYSQNPDSASALYDSKIVMVTGTVGLIDTAFAKVKITTPDTIQNPSIGQKIGRWFFTWATDQVNDVRISFKDYTVSADSSNWTIHAKFPTEYIAEVEKLKLEQTVKLKCLCSGPSTVTSQSNGKTSYWKSVWLLGCVIQP